MHMSNLLNIRNRQSAKMTEISSIGRSLLDGYLPFSVILTTGESVPDNNAGHNYAHIFEGTHAVKDK